MYCTTDLCLTVNNMKKREKENNVKCTDVSVHVMYILSTVVPENTLHPCSTRSAASQALSRHSSLVPPKTCSQSFLAERLHSLVHAQKFREEICCVVFRIHASH